MKNTTIVLTVQQIVYLEMLVNADMKSRVDDQRHAAAYGGAHVDTQISECEDILNSLKSSTA